MARRPQNEGLAMLAALLGGGGRRGRLAGALELGPGGARFVPIGDDDEDDGSDDEITILGVALGKSLSLADFGDYALQHEPRWQRANLDGVVQLTTQIRFTRDVDSENTVLRDVHTIALVREEHDPDSWAHWSLCPHQVKAVVTMIRGSEEHVLRAANVMNDYFAGHLKSEEISRMVVDGVAKTLKRRKQKD